MKQQVKQMNLFSRNNSSIDYLTIVNGFYNAPESKDGYCT